MITSDQLHEKLKNVTVAGSTCSYTEEYCDKIAPMINEINRLKKETNTVILAHSYVNPEIVYGVSDYTGDSYQLSRNALESGADNILFVAVKFMAETAKILNPEKNVYVPAALNGCSLADSITGADVRKLKQDNPDYTFVCYINTTADVKAQCDVCVTSGNVYNIIEDLPTDKVFFVPDKLMGLNIIDEMKRRGVEKDIKLWDGVCYVHEEYDPDMIDYIRGEFDGVKVLAHPECSPGVLHHSDFVGSTAQLLKFMETSAADDFLMLTECGLSARLQVEMPEKNFVGSCSVCKYMKANTLENVLECLKNPKSHNEIHLTQEDIDGSRRCIDAMFHYAEKRK